ncbi:MAG: hypothetical protein Q7S03_02045 [bacterium]|nr:hypothetical protein [bacterium]
MFYVINIGDEFKLGNGKGVDQVFPSLGGLVSLLIGNIFIIVGVVFFLLLIFGGFSLIMGAGGGNPQQSEKGKQAVTYAVIGFLVIFLSYWIVQIIEAITGLNILNSPL